MHDDDNVLFTGTIGGQAVTYNVSREILELIDPLEERGWAAVIVHNGENTTLHMLSLGDPNDAGCIWIMEDMDGPDGESLFESEETDEFLYNLDIARQMVARAEEMEAALESLK